jgi:hypothetical protein
MSDPALIHTRVENGVAVLTLDNPPLNLVTLELTRRLRAALDRLADDPAARVLVVTGAGKLPSPDRYALEPNRPNPFNPVTTIAYDLAHAGESRLVVYDVSGARVRELVDTKQPAGRYAVSWDGRDDAGRSVASGVYFYRLTSGAFSQTRKMVLLK